MKHKYILVFLFFVSQLSLAIGQNWEVDFEKAKQEASTSDKPIIMVFQGSDWCAPCMKLDKEIWSSDEFKNYADDHYILLQVDFPRRRKNALSKEQAAANAMLAEKYNKTGMFPYVAVLDKEGNKLGDTGYKKTPPKTYIEELNSFIQ